MQTLTVSLCTSSPAQQTYTTCMVFPPGLRPVEAFWLESLPRVLTVFNSGDHSLCFPASGSDSPAGCLAPLDQTICFRTQPITTLLPRVLIFMTCCGWHSHERLS